MMEVNGMYGSVYGEKGKRVDIGGSEGGVKGGSGREFEEIRSLKKRERVELYGSEGRMM